MLIFGGELNDFARLLYYVALVGGVLIGATQIVVLFDATGASIGKGHAWTSKELPNRCRHCGGGGSWLRPDLCRALFPMTRAYGCRSTFRIDKTHRQSVARSAAAGEEADRAKSIRRCEVFSDTTPGLPNEARACA